MGGVCLYDLIEERHYDLLKNASGKSKRKWTDWKVLFLCERNNNGYEKAVDFLNSINKKPRHLYRHSTEFIVNPKDIIIYNG